MLRSLLKFLFAAAGIMLAVAVALYAVLFFTPRPLSGEEKSIVINKAQNRLYLFENGDLLKKYTVATGKKENMTPEGTFKIANKSPNPGNPLFGSRWMGLGTPGHEDGTKYGIHGTNEPLSIGGHCSHGCIRMSKKDVEDLYQRVPAGTPVKIEHGLALQRIFTDYLWENSHNYFSSLILRL